MPEGGLNIRLQRHHPRAGSAAATTTSATPCSPSSAPTSSTSIITSGGRNPEDRHHHHRQVLSRRAPGARRARHRRGALQRSRHSRSTRSAARGRSAARRTGRIRQGPRPHHRGRGEALADRGAGARGALRHRQPAGLHRQEGRARRLAVPGQGRARSERRRDLHRRAPAGSAGTTTRSPRRCRA